MRRSASEIIRDLEVRIAQLEATANIPADLSQSERQMLVDFVKSAEKVFPIVNSVRIQNRRAKFDTAELLGLLLGDLNSILHQ